MLEKNDLGTTAETAAGKDRETEPARKVRKPAIVAGLVLAVLVVAGVGFWSWHEQPSFCNAVCHTPMDEYNRTYDQTAGEPGTDKWGNALPDAGVMLSVSHKASAAEGGADAACMSCHVPTLSEQLSEGTAWISGDYVYPLEERSTKELTAARGVDEDEFCLNENCHNMTREELVQSTSDMSFNPHVMQHGKISCSECHKAHRAPVMYCSQCHSEAEIPEGWLSAAEDKALSRP